jgi:hypothetical protein
VDALVAAVAHTRGPKAGFARNPIGRARSPLRAAAKGLAALPKCEASASPNLTKQSHKD